MRPGGPGAGGPNLAATGVPAPVPAGEVACGSTAAGAGSTVTGGRGHSLGGRIPWWAAGLVCYGATAALIYSRTLAHLDTSIPNLPDGILFVWWMAWLPHALATGQSPLVTHALNYPAGANEMWNTSVPLLALLAAPVTLTAGPVVAANLCFVAGPVASGLAALWALRRCVARLGPALVGGFVYGFSPLIRTASAGHLHLVWAVFPPLLFVLVDEIVVRQRRSPYLLGALLGALCAAQLLVSTEMLAFGVLVAVVGVGLLAVCYPRQVPDRAPAVLRALLTAALLFAVLGWYPIAVLLTGPQRLHGYIQPPGKYVADLWGFVVPVALQAISPPAARAISNHFDAGDLAEASTYLGIPLVLVVLAATVVWWRRPLVRVTSLTLAAVALLSLGPWLHVGGVSYRWLLLPWNLVQRMPLLRNAEPVRLSVFVLFLAALLLALVLDAILSARATAARLGAAAIALAVVIPLLPATSRPDGLPATPAFFTAAATLDRIPAGAPVVVVPYPSPRRDVAMLWQARAGLRFAMPGGYQLVPSPTTGMTFRAPPGPLGLALILIARGQRVVLAPPLRAASVAWLRRIDPAAVLLGPMPYAARAKRLLTELLGRPPAGEAGVLVWWAPVRG